MSEEIDILEIFPWNKHFETGIKEIDDQHNELINLLNKLANSLTQDEELHIEETFNELANYADFHFKSEEAIWKKYIKDKSIIEEHESAHSSFLPKVLNLQEKNKHKSLHEIVEEILLFLIRWLAFHIINEDKRLALLIQAINEKDELNLPIINSTENQNTSVDILIEAILSMYDSLSIKAIKLIRERKARIKAENELKEINKKLKELSITDQLTTLYNRRYFEKIFQRELKKAQRNKTIFSIILFDIDYFKKLNDTYGHAKGDEALVKVANCLKGVCKRPNDFTFRIGGEEFTIIITNEKKDTAYKLAKILQKEIKELEIENKNSHIYEYLTISAGVVSIHPSKEDTIESIMRLTDKKLYKAKETRDTVII